MLLRLGNAGPNTFADHEKVLAAAIRQVPARFRRKVLVRFEGAGASRSTASTPSSRLARPHRQGRRPAEPPVQVLAGQARLGHRLSVPSTTRCIYAINSSEQRIRELPQWVLATDSLRNDDGPAVI
jgi:hypothetical protein